MIRLPLARDAFTHSHGWRCSTSVPLKLTLSDITAVVNDCNAWIEEQWTSWWNFGWLFLGCFFVRFVRNDMLFRAPLRAFLAERTALLVERSGATFELYRKVKTYGYGETSKTVVKVSLVIVDAFASPDLFEESTRCMFVDQRACLTSAFLQSRAPRCAKRWQSCGEAPPPLQRGEHGRSVLTVSARTQAERYGSTQCLGASRVVSGGVLQSGAKACFGVHLMLTPSSFFFLFLPLSAQSMEPIDAGSEGTDSVALRPMAPSPAAPPASVLVATTPSPLEPPLRTYTHTAGPVPFDEEESG